MSDSFYITLPSNASTLTFPQNAGGHFRTILSEDIYLDEGWEVGLAEFTYVQNSWYNIREGENKIKIIKANQVMLTHYGSHKPADKIVWCAMAVRQVATLNDLIINFTVYPKVGGQQITGVQVFFEDEDEAECYTIAQICQEFNNLMIQGLPANIGSVVFKVDGTIDVTVKDATKANFTVMWRDEFKKLFTFSHPHIDSTKKEKYRFTVIDNKNHFKTPHIDEVILEPMHYNSVSGLLYDVNECMYRKVPDIRNVISFSLQKDISRVQFNCGTAALHTEIVLSPTISRMLGYRETDTFNYQADKRMAQNLPNLHFTLPTLWVYTNIVEAVIVGDIKANLLRIIPVEYASAADGIQSQGTIIKVFERPHYMELSTSTIQNIEILIAAGFNAIPIDFTNNIITKLHFRKKRSVQL